jgi:hypothetical protein
MNRLERALTKLADAPTETKRQLQEYEHWNRFKESTERLHAEIREIGARSDVKIKALVEEMQKRNAQLS